MVGDVNGIPHLLICGPEGQIVCNPSADQIVCNMTNLRQISFEPTVELKFSNFHSANQVVNGRLICTVDGAEFPDGGVFVRPVNTELLSDAKEGDSSQYSDLYYYYDYQKRFIGISTPVEGGNPTSEPRDGDLLSPGLSDR